MRNHSLIEVVYSGLVSVLQGLRETAGGGARRFPASVSISPKRSHSDLRTGAAVFVSSEGILLVFGFLMLVASPALSGATCGVVGNWPGGYRGPAFNVVADEGHAYVALGYSGLGIYSVTGRAPIPGLFSTGVSDYYGRLGEDDSEPHYRLVAPSAVAGVPFVATSLGGFPIPPWLADSPDSAWIAPAKSTVGPNETNGAPNFYYQTTFNLSGRDPATARISGRWATDNRGVDILINGVSTGQSNPSQYGTWTPFQIFTGFIPGLNTLTFVINNGAGESSDPGPTGLRVELTGETDAVPGVPIGGWKSDGLLRELVLRDGRVFALEGSNLRIINVAHPESSFLESTFDLQSQGSSIALAWPGLVYVAAGDAGVVLVDVTNPAQPTEVARIAEPGAKLVAYDGFPPFGNFLYVWYQNPNGGFSGLKTYSMLTPSSPVPGDFFPSTLNATDLYFKNFVLYISAGSAGLVTLRAEGVSLGIDVIHTLDPESQDIQGVARIGSTAYVADGNGRVFVVDSAVPEELSVLGTIPIPNGTGLGAWVDPNTQGSAGAVYVAGGPAGIELINSDVGPVLEFSRTLPTAGSANQALLRGNIAYVADSFGSFQILNATKRDALGLYSEYPVPGGAYALDVSGNYAYLAAQNEGLYVMDVSNPQSPVKLSSLRTGLYPRAVKAMNNRVYVGDLYSGVSIVDLPNPFEPALLSKFETNLTINDFELTNNLAFLATTAGLRVWDVSNPLKPRFISAYKTNVSVADVVVSGGLGFVASGPDQLDVVDIRDVNSLRLISSTNTHGFIADLALNGSQLLVANYSGTKVYANRGENQLVEIGNYPARGQAQSVSIEGSFALVAESAFGVEAIDLGCLPFSPYILSQPSNRSVSSGSSVAFSVTASGDAPLTYQWRLNGAAILNATSPSFIIPSAQKAHEGAYSVLVQNPAGLVASLPATLTVQLVNSAPVISDIADQTVFEDQTVGPVSFTIGDLETPAGNLSVTASSTNTALVPLGNIALFGSGSNRTVTLIPSPNLSGRALITVSVNDGNGGNVSDTFLVTVIATNDPPTLNAIGNVTMMEDTTSVVNLGGITSGAANEVQTLVVTAVSSNPGVLPNPAVTYTSPSTSGTLTLSPAPNANGSATVTVTVNDGAASNNLFTRVFNVTIIATNDPPTLNTISDVT
ncbi:MAG: immunoglobulin domain-containing protein, partial [Verrucomicrobia bacterium]|nr:immunoglobulin domain-containing protein [Verrucomicrobiota bacterium]